MSVSPSFRIKSGVQDGCAALRVGVSPSDITSPDSLPPLTAATAGRVACATLLARKEEGSESRCLSACHRPDCSEFWKPALVLG